MRNKSFEKLLKDAIVLAAEERGTRLDREPVEPAPLVAQARLDAVLNGKRKEPKRTASDASSEQPKKLAQRRLTYVLTAASAAAVVLVAVFLIGTGGLLGTKSVKDAVMPTEQPLMQTETTAAPGAPGEQELGEPLPFASATFADKTAASTSMMRFYEENRTLLMAVAEDLKVPEHVEIKNGVVYPIKDDGFVDWDHPYASMTDAIRAFLDLPDSVDYVLFWNDSIFHVSLQWTNDSGYYSTELVFAEDGQRIVNMMSEKGGSTLEPVYEDGAWGVYTICWQKAPYYYNASYAFGRETGVWETDDVPFLYLELLDDGTARILERFEDADIRAHYAWDYNRDCFRITFSDQTVVSTAELHINTDAMTLTLADGSTVEATRAEGVVLPLRASDTDRTRNTAMLPAVCPAYALGTSAKEPIEGILFRYDLDGDGTAETISFRQSPDDGDTPVIISIDEREYPLAELDPRDKVRQAILLKPDPASEDLALVLTTEDLYADWNETAILLLHGREVREIKGEYNDAYAYLQDGSLRITARCWLMGTYYGSRAYSGTELKPESEWYETGVLDRVKDWTREKQIEFNYLFKVVRDLPCTIDGKPAVIEPGTWVYLLRWKDTDDFAKVMTEDGRIATLTFTPEYDRYLDGTTYVRAYLIDGIDAETYFDNLNMAG